MITSFINRLFNVNAGARDNSTKSEIVAPVRQSHIKVKEDEPNEKYFKDVIMEWLNYHHMEIEESTYYGYKMLCPVLIDYFGDISIEKIDTFAINEFILTLRNEGVTKASIYNRCRVLKLCFEYSCNNGYITQNPVCMACVPKVPKHTEVFPFTVEEVIKLLKVDCPQWIKGGIIIAFHTGMRRGEIYALKWIDIDLEQRFIMVQRSQSSAGSKVIIKSTKTACGIRRIDIDRYLVAYLSKMKSQSNSDYVFASTEVGSKYPYRVPWNLAAHVKKMCMMAGIPPRNFHALRHAHATVLLAHGVHPKIVQERLGHSDTSITMMTYSHVMPTIQQEAVEVFEKICGKLYDDGDAVAIIDNIIELEFARYGECYYVDNTHENAVVS